MIRLFNIILSLSSLNCQLTEWGFMSQSRKFYLYQAHHQLSEVAEIVIFAVNSGNCAKRLFKEPHIYLLGIFKRTIWFIFSKIPTAWQKNTHYLFPSLGQTWLQLKTRTPTYRATIELLQWFSTIILYKVMKKIL